jgi:hypothetical protein
MNNINNSLSLQEIQSSFLDIARKYLSDKNGDELDVNTLKSGFFGWSLETLGQIVKDDIITETFLLDEPFLNTAKLPQSVFNFAVKNNYEIYNSTPSRGKAIFNILYTDIKDNLEENQFKIDRKTNFTINNLNFMLPYGITIKAIDGKEPIVSYDIKEKNFDHSFDSPYLIKNLFVNSDDGKEYLSIIVDLYQVELTTKYFSNENLNVNIDPEYSIEFSEQLASFNVKYKVMENLDYTYLEKYLSEESLTFNNDSLYYCTYYLKDSNDLHIKFSKSTGGFSPEINSILEMEVFSSKGSLGNINYNSDLQHTWLGYSNITSNVIFLNPLNSVLNGKDQESLKEIKSGILRKVQSNNVLITDIDIKNYFQQFQSYFTNNLIEISKSRLDSIKNEFFVFLLFKDSLDRIIPTNTINLTLKQDANFNLFDDLTTNDNKSIKAGSYLVCKKKFSDVEGIVYNNSNNCVLYDASNNDIPLFEDDESAALYDIAYYIDRPSLYYVYNSIYGLAIKNDPFIRCNYYRTFINEFKPLKTVAINNENIHQIFANSFSINRDQFTSNKYNITLSLSSVLDNTSDLTKLFSRMFIYDIDDNEKKYHCNVIGVPTFNEETNKVDVKFELYTNDVFNNDNKLQIIDNANFHLYNNPILEEAYVESVYDEIFLPENIHIDFLVSYNFDSEITPTSFNVTDIEDNITEVLDHSNLSECNGVTYDLQFVNCIKMSSIGEVKLFNDINNITTSDITFNAENEVIVKDIPVVDSNFYTNEDDEWKQLLRNISYYEELLESSIDLNRNNTNFNFKFFNTKGNSLNTTSNFTNFSLNLEVILNNGYTSNDIDVNLKTFITQIVENINDKNDYITLSNITTAIENNFPNEIKGVVIQLINNQKLEKIENISEENLKQNNNNYIPEYKNVDYDFELDNYKILIAYK